MTGFKMIQIISLCVFVPLAAVVQYFILSYELINQKLLLNGYQNKIPAQ